MKLLGSLKKLRHEGVLGMNARNVNYISRYNNRRFYPLVDNKLLTKKLLHKHNLITPKLLFVVHKQHEVNAILSRIDKLKAFVIKPARGSGGKGILVIRARKDDAFIKASGEVLTLFDIKRHLTNVLAGLYSLSGLPDVALFEDLIIADDMLTRYSYEGVPDIRIIVFQGYPVMAMLRLSTKSSDGKANLHQGAVGVGINLQTAQAEFAVQNEHQVHTHPDTHMPLDTLHIAHWRSLLELAAQCYEITQLGYLGADIIIDKHKGPMLLELNARPGLSIQVANAKGLVPRLRTIEALQELSTDYKARVDFVQNQAW